MILSLEKVREALGVGVLPAICPRPLGQCEQACLRHQDEPGHLWAQGEPLCGPGHGQKSLESPDWKRVWEDSPVAKIVFNIEKFTVKSPLLPFPPSFHPHVIPRGYSFPRTLIRDNHQLGGLKQQKFILSGSRCQSPKSGVDIAMIF